MLNALLLLQLQSAQLGLAHLNSYNHVTTKHIHVLANVRRLAMPKPQTT